MAACYDSTAGFLSMGSVVATDVNIFKASDFNSWETSFKAYPTSNGSFLYQVGHDQTSGTLISMDLNTDGKVKNNIGFNIGKKK